MASDDKKSEELIAQQQREAAIKENSPTSAAQPAPVQPAPLSVPLPPRRPEGLDAPSAPAPTPARPAVVKHAAAPATSADDEKRLPLVGRGGKLPQGFDRWTENGLRGLGVVKEGMSAEDRTKAISEYMQGAGKEGKTAAADIAAQVKADVIALQEKINTTPITKGNDANYGQYDLGKFGEKKNGVDGKFGEFTRAATLQFAAAQNATSLVALVRGKAEEPATAVASAAPTPEEAEAKNMTAGAFLTAKQKATDTAETAKPSVDMLKAMREFEGTPKHMNFVRQGEKLDAEEKAKAAAAAPALTAPVLGQLQDLQKSLQEKAAKESAARTVDIVTARNPGFNARETLSNLAASLGYSTSTETPSTPEITEKQAVDGLKTFGNNLLSAAKGLVSIGAVFTPQPAGEEPTPGTHQNAQAPAGRNELPPL